MQNLYHFEFIHDQLMNMGAVHSASELHGLLCGFISAGSTLTAEAWQPEALQFLDLEYLELTEEQASVFALMLEKTTSLLADDHYRFMPLLPSDDSALLRRADELGAWCSGFLHGLGKVLGAREDKQLSAEVADAMRDIASITQISVDEDDNLEENEAYWIELVEYVKVAVITVYNELRRSAASTLH